MQPQSPREQELTKMAWQEGNEAAWRQEGWAENPYSKDLPGWVAAGSNTRPATVAPGEEAKKSLSQGRRQKEKDAVQWWNDQNKQRYQDVLALGYGFQVWTAHRWLWGDKEDNISMTRHFRSAGGSGGYEVPDSDYRVCMARPTKEQFEECVYEKGMTAQECVGCQVNVKSGTRRAIRLIENVRL